MSGPQRGNPDRMQLVGTCTHGKRVALRHQDWRPVKPSNT